MKLPVLALACLTGPSAWAEVPDCSATLSADCFINCADVQTQAERLFCPQRADAVLPEGYEYLACPTGGSQFALRVCADKSYIKADKELNAAYAAALSRVRQYDLSLQPGVRTGESYLRETQRAWIIFRDAHAEAYVSRFNGGSVGPMIRLNVLEHLTRHRIDELLNLAQESFP